MKTVLRALSCSPGAGHLVSEASDWIVIWWQYPLLAPSCMNRSLIVSPILPRGSADPDGGQHAERGHPVEHVAANLCLGLLIGQSPGVKPPAGHDILIFCRILE